MTVRVEKMNDLIRDYVGEIIGQELSLKKGVLVSIVKVDTSADFRYSRLFISVFPKKEELYTINTLKKESGRIRKFLSEKLKTRILPEIRFQTDDTQEKISAMEEIFKKISEEKAEF